MNLFDYIYYKAYKFQEFVGNAYPKYPTIIFLSGLIIFNFTSIYCFLLPFFNFLKLKEIEIYFFAIVLLTLIIGFNLYYFNRKHELIMNYYNNNKYNKKKNNHLLIISIIIFTLLMIYGSAYFSYYKANIE